MRATKKEPLQPIQSSPVDVEAQKLRDDLLKTYEDKELEAELKKRRDERQRKLEEAHRARYEKIVGLMTDENKRSGPETARTLLDILLPEHTRTSCNDNDLANGWGSNGSDSLPRCTRCALLELLLNTAFGEVPYGCGLAIEIRGMPERKTQ